MIATQHAVAEPLVWISEAGKRDAATIRLNQKKVRQQAKRFHVATKERQRLEQAPTFAFVNEFPVTSRSSEIDSSTSADNSIPPSSASSTIADIDEDQLYGESRSQSTGNRAVIKSESSTRKRILRLRTMALKLQHIAEGGYSAARLQYNFDLLDLSTFTSAHMGRAAAASLHDKQLARQNLLRVRESSFLDHIPQLYPQSHLLRTVVDSVLAQAQKTLCHNPRISQAEVFSLYETAIRELQEALADRTMAFEADVLCSVQLMQLFEALNSNYLVFWEQHSAGIRRLLRMRGPERCDSDFERALLYSQLGTIFGEALIERTDCFLAEPLWQSAFCRFIRLEQSLHKRTELKLWSIEVLVPGFMREADEVVHSLVLHDEDVLQDLYTRLRRHKVESLRLEDEASSCVDSEPNTVCFRMLENLALAYGADMLVNRILIALNPLAPESAVLETETVALAQKVLSTAEHLTAHAPRADLLVARAMSVARMVVATHEGVLTAVDGSLEGVNLETGRIRADIWEAQSRLVMRKPIFE